MENAPPFPWVVVLKIAKPTAWTSLNINANSAARLLNGSAGVIHISVSPATKSNVQATTCRENPAISYRSVKEKMVVVLSK